MSTTTRPATATSTRPPELLPQTIRRRAEEEGQERTFTFLGDGQTESDHLTFAQLDGRARAIAAHLQARATPGDRALLVFEPGLEFVAAFFGCLYAGIIAVPVYPPDPRRLPQTLPRFLSIAADSRPRVVLGSTFVVNAMRAGLAGRPQLADAEWLATDKLGIEASGDFVEPGLSERDIAFLQYTSGSTAEPKGVQVTQGNIVANSDAITASFGHTSETNVVSWLPLYHDMGLIGNVLHTSRVCAHNVLMSPIAFLQRPLRWLEAISRTSAHTSGGPNFGYELCCRRVSPEERAELDLSSWKVAYNGAEPVRAETLDRFARAFDSCGFRKEAFLPCFGLAESTLIVSGGPWCDEPKMCRVRCSDLARHLVTETDEHDPDGQSIMSSGEIIPPGRAIIVDPETRSPCASGHVGEIWLAGPSVATGYWGNPEETQQTFGATFDGDDDERWFRTGDLGFVKGGELYITGRIKDLVIIRGRNHYPQDIEWTAEHSHEALRPGCAAAFSLDLDGEERLALDIEVSRSLTEEEKDQVMAAIRQDVLGTHEVPLHLVVLLPPRTIPKTSSGKIRRGATRDAYLKGALKQEASSRVEAPGRDAEGHQEVDRAEGALGRRIVQAMRDCLPRGGRRIDLTPETTLRGDLGMDSLATIDLLVRIEQVMGVGLDPDTLAGLCSVGDVIRAIEKATGDAPREERDLAGGIGALKQKLLEEIPQIRVVVDEQRGRDLLIDGRWIADFASANYLGLDLHPRVMAAIPPAVERWGVHPSWTPIVATPRIYQELEEELAAFIGAPDVLVFPTITLLHQGVLPILASEDGVILLDQAAHNSIHEAALFATTRGTSLEVISHDDLDEMERALRRHRGQSKRIIAIDGVYSMKGSYAPLPALVELAKRHDATIYVDDAHGFGVIGEGPTPEQPWGRRGNGLVKYHGLRYAEDHIVYVAGMSKAFSSLAAFITCAEAAERELLYSASTSVFSGPCPTASLASAVEGIRTLEAEPSIRARLLERSRGFVQGARELGFTVDNHDFFPLASVVVGGISNVVRGCQILWDHGVLITPALFPAVPLDRGALRFTITAANTTKQVDRALAALREIKESLDLDLTCREESG